MSSQAHSDAPEVSAAAAAVPHVVPSRQPGIRAVWMLIAVVGFIAGLGAAAVSGWDAVLREPRLPWWLLAILFYVAELAVVHLKFRNDAHSFSMSEIPLVLGLFFADPLALIAGQVIGNTAALLISRRQPWIKLAFNVAQFSLQAVVAIAVFRTVASLGSPLGSAGWLASAAATLGAMLVADSLINSAIRLTGGNLDPQEVAEVLALSSLAAIMNTGLALAAVAVLAEAPQVAWLTLLPPAVLFFAYRAYTSQRRERFRLEALYEATRILHQSGHVDTALEAAGRYALNMFGAACSEIVIFPSGTTVHGFVTTVAHDGTSRVMHEFEGPRVADMADRVIGEERGAILAPSSVRFAGEPDRVARTEAIVAPLVSADGINGYIMVADLMGDVSEFNEGDLKLLETMAGHIAVSLENGRLENSLTQLTALKEQLRHQATHDPLTGIANRVLFTQRAEDALRDAEPTETIAALFLDLDEFKAVNDRFGHAVGDELLIEVANRLQSACRPDDVVARFGGDEFAILLAGLEDASFAVDVAERVLRSLERPVVVDGKQLNVGASIGIAFATPGADADELLRNADAAMYTAKRQGRGVYRLFEEEVHAALIERLELRADLAKAIDRDELDVVYQPIVNVKGGAIAGFEALVRWRHPIHGQVPPSRFIDIAEESGLIVPLGRWVLRTATRQAAEWQVEIPDRRLTVHVNVSTRQLTAPGFVDDVAKALLDVGLNPSRLVLEITESVLMGSNPEILDHLKQLGVRIAIDDFGTGYSSLSYLDRLSIDVIKVDKSFVRRLGDPDHESPLVRAILGIGSTLGLETVVEGIETLRQADRLTELGCTYAQGFFFGEPVEPGETLRIAAEMLGVELPPASIVWLRDRDRAV